MLLWIALLSVLTLLIRWTGWADRAFFHPGRDTPPPPVGAEEVWFTNPEGERLHGWLLKPGGTFRPPVVVHCHGNAGTIDDHLPFSDFLVDHGFAVFIFDYRGYGRSASGKPSRTSIIQDAAAALDAVLARDDLDGQRVAMLGVSLGSVPASHIAASRPQVRALALVAPFSSWSGVASDHVPLIGRVLVRTGSDPVQAITELKAPLLLLHGDRDTIILAKHSERLAERARSAGVPTTLETVPGADHNDIMEFQAARTRLAEFLADTLNAP